MAKKEQKLGTLTPYISIKGAAKAIEFYKKAFNAEVVYRIDMPDGKIMHAQLKIGDSFLMLSDEFPSSGECGVQSPRTLKGTTNTLHLVVKDVDKSFAQAVKAGAKVKMLVMDAFWGDRYGQLEDPFGHIWSIATPKEKVSPKEVLKRAMQLFAKK
jgi:PhnB protein